MNRLLKKQSKKKIKVDDRVRMSDDKDTFYYVLDYNEESKTYTVRNELGEVFDQLQEQDILGEDEFFQGDEVVYFKHPYDNDEVFSVKEVLSDGTYFIENDKTAYTNITGRNLELVEK